MKRLVIFGMFIGMMIAKPADAFFGKDSIKKIKDRLGLPEQKKPVIEAISPSSGSHGIKVKIIGKNFDSAQMPITTFSPVYFDTGIGGVIGGAYAEIIPPRTDTEIIVEAPEGKGTVMVTVGSSNEVSFTYLPPVIENIDPCTGQIGKNIFLPTKVTLTGKNFGFHRPTNPLIPCLLFGISPIHDFEIQQWTDNKIVFRTPIDGGIGLNIPPEIVEIIGLATDPPIDEFVNPTIAYAIRKKADSASKKGYREVNIVVKTLAGESNAVVFTYQAEATEEGLATALVIDRSGSMKGEKIRRAKEAAYVYVDTCAEQQDLFSLAAFSTDAASITEPISIAKGREMLKKDILSLSAGGNTNVGSGLTIALSHLSSANRKSKKAVLLSDGMHNTGTYKPEVAEFQKMGWPISTVAFGKDADQETLRWIAEQTGGSFFPANEQDIASVYHKINVLAHNGSVYRSYNDFIRPGQKLSYNIPVEPDMKKVGFFTNWQGSKMETTLFSPNKTVINRSNVSNLGRFVEGETHNCFEINNPQCGNWQASISGSELPPKGEQVNFHSFCESDVFSNILGFQPNYSQGKPVQIGIKLAEVINGHLSPLRGAQVTADVKKPSLSLARFISDIQQKRLQPENLLEIFKEISGSAQKIILFDDGNHQDVGLGDGIYANTYNDTTINGPYLVAIDLQATTSLGMPMKRTLQESFQVGPIEQNSFTTSEFLGLLTQQGVNRQMPFSIPGTEGPKESQTEEFMKSLLDQLIKK